MATLTFETASFVAPDGRVLVDAVDLEVGSGAVTVLAGPSGAGKSTLLRLANRLEVPSSGSVRLDGDDLTDLEPRAVRRRVGMVFQRPVPFAGTVRENLLVGAPGTSDDDLDAALDRVRLPPSMRDRIADDLSGGEAQRMCLARTLLTDPEVLLMDEPTSSLDPDGRRGIEELARGFADRGLAVLWVSHDLEQIARIADRVVVMVDGRLATDLEASEFLGGRRR